MSIVFLDKPKGLTPLELINKYRELNNINDKICFAGRLDPMAQGQMILLIGEQCKNVKLYLNLNKTYEFMVLFNFKSDTYDLLGKVNYLEKNIEKFDNINNYLGILEQEYPPFSSMIVKYNNVKHPLWKWTKMGYIDKIRIPKKKVEIYDILEIHRDDNIINSEDLKKYIFDNISLLQKENYENFRVKEILDFWNNIFYKNNFKNHIPKIKKYRASVSSGTYIRSLINKIGNDLGCGALSLDIKRVDLSL
jgi:tRNA pseudouridine55 synthase